MKISRMTGKGLLEIRDALTIALGGCDLGTVRDVIHMTAPRTINGTTYTAYIAGTQIAVTATEETMLRQAMTAASLARPHVATRIEIVNEIAEYRRQQVEAIARAGDGASMDYSPDRRLAEATGRLAQYDVAHPEEIAQIATEDADSRARFERAD